MANELTSEQKAELMTKYIQENYFPEWTFEESLQMINSAGVTGTHKMNRTIGTSQGTVIIPITIMDGTILVGGKDIIGVLGNNVIQQHYGTGDNIAGDKNIFDKNDDSSTTTKDGNSSIGFVQIIFILAALATIGSFVFGFWDKGVSVVTKSNIEQTHYGKGDNVAGDKTIR